MSDTRACENVIANTELVRRRLEKLESLMHAVINIKPVFKVMEGTPSDEFLEGIIEGLKLAQTEVYNLMKDVRDVYPNLKQLKEIKQELEGTPLEFSSERARLYFGRINCNKGNPHECYVIREGDRYVTVCRICELRFKED